MNPLFSEDARRNPYPHYAHFRQTSPVCRDPQSRLWMLFRYEDVKRGLSDSAAFSSRIGPVEWLIFLDPPRHGKLRALISQAFTPRSVANLEPRIAEIARELLAPGLERGEIDIATEFAFPLPMRVIADLLGAPASDRSSFQRWNDVILRMSYTVGNEANPAIQQDFAAATAQMNEYLGGLLEERRCSPRNDLLSGLLAAEVEGERLTQQEILGLFQLLLLAGSETTTNLIGNAVLSFLEHPGELDKVQAQFELLPSAIEEVLRFRSPLQWMLRRVMSDVSMGGQQIQRGAVVLPMMGAANRDPAVFTDPDRFDVQRTPNPHVAFGHGIHSCLGAALARLEARVALHELLSRVTNLQRRWDGPWQPREGLHVHGPQRLPISFERVRP